MGDKHRHPKEHNAERSGEREDISLFPLSIVAIENFESLSRSGLIIKQAYFLMEMYRDNGTYPQLKKLYVKQFTQLPH